MLVAVAALITMCCGPKGKFKHLILIDKILIKTATQREAQARKKKAESGESK